MWDLGGAFLASGAGRVARLRDLLPGIVGRRSCAQVDRIGVWFTETYERRFPGLSQDQDRVEEAGVEVHVRNASDLPVDVVQLAYEVRTRWMVPVQPESPVHAHVETAGNGCVSASSLTSSVLRLVRRSAYRPRSMLRIWLLRERCSFRRCGA